MTIRELYARRNPDVSQFAFSSCSVSFSTFSSSSCILLFCDAETPPNPSSSSIQVAAPSRSCLASLSTNAADEATDHDVAGDRWVRFQVLEERFLHLLSLEKRLTLYPGAEKTGFVNFVPASSERLVAGVPEQAHVAYEFCAIVFVHLEIQAAQAFVAPGLRRRALEEVCNAHGKLDRVQLLDAIDELYEVRRTLSSVLLLGEVVQPAAEVLMLLVQECLQSAGCFLSLFVLRPETAASRCLRTSPLRRTLLLLHLSQLARAQTW